MDDESKIQEFPDISSKLTAPSKKSLYERQKAEAEAKRLREEAETAAVYEDFVKSFEDNETPKPSLSGPGNRRSGPGTLLGSSFGDIGVGGPPKRHFAGASTGPASGKLGIGARSGPGSLGPLAPSLSRKRAHDGTSAFQRELNQAGDLTQSLAAPAAAFQTSDDEDEAETGPGARERAVPKPTLHLSCLPPGTSQAVIKSLVPASLNVDAVRILPPAGPGSTERKSLSAIVTLARDTPASDIDTAVNALQHRYLGFGFYLSISRHLSSAALGTGASVSASLNSALSSLPFGARPTQGPGLSLARAPPPGPHRGGIAPPSSFATSDAGLYGRGTLPLQVSVRPPSNLKKLKLIHKTIEAMLTHGPEFEALLMSRPEVQRDEKWAWLWDPRSVGGVWFRWRLWEILTGSSASKGRSHSNYDNLKQTVFEGAAPWVSPENNLRFEYTTRLDEFVSDPDYDSSEDEDSAGEESMEKAFLNPLQKAKFTHLLARLPRTTARLRRGDVARVTAFAIEHAGRGGDEVVDIIVSNIEQPFAYRTAHPESKNSRADADDAAEDNMEDKSKDGKEDTSSAKLIALYLVSDILSSSSTSGVRHAWRYRGLFEAALKRRKLFESLGRLEKDLQWGRLRADKWKRSVNSVLSLWEGWCVFPQATQEHFSSVFSNPPLTAAEEAAVAAESAAASAPRPSAPKSKWKTVDVNASPAETPQTPDIAAASSTLPEAPTEEAGLDGEPMVEDEDIDGVPMDEDIDGVPMPEEDEDVDGMPMQNDLELEPQGVDLDAQESGRDSSVSKKEGSSTNSSNITTNDFKGAQPLPTQEAPPRRRRPKAEDMFADSDEGE